MYIYYRYSLCIYTTAIVYVYMLQVETIFTVLQTRSVAKIAQVVRSIKPLSFEIRKQNSQVCLLCQSYPLLSAWVEKTQLLIDINMYYT